MKQLFSPHSGSEFLPLSFEWDTVSLYLGSDTSHPLAYPLAWIPSFLFLVLGHFLAQKPEPSLLGSSTSCQCAVTPLSSWGGLPCLDTPNGFWNTLFRKGRVGREENEREREQRRGRDKIILNKVCKRINNVKIDDSF